MRQRCQMGQANIQRKSDSNGSNLHTFRNFILLLLFSHSHFCIYGIRQTWCSDWNYTQYTQSAHCRKENRNVCSIGDLFFKQHKKHFVQLNYVYSPFSLFSFHSNHMKLESFSPLLFDFHRRPTIQSDLLYRHLCMPWRPAGNVIEKLLSWGLWGEKQKNLRLCLGFIRLLEPCSPSDRLSDCPKPSSKKKKTEKKGSSLYCNSKWSRLFFCVQ